MMEGSDGAVESSDNNTPAVTGHHAAVKFPPPALWYKTNVTAARDDMWAYLAGQVIVLVVPKITHTRTVGTDLGEASPISAAGAVEEGSDSVWPEFKIFGYQREYYNCISFCQSGFEYLPVKGAPLVTGCKEGFVRIWNVNQECVMYHDVHKIANKKNVNVVCVDWSVRNPLVIYSMDEEGCLVSWHIRKAKLKMSSFGKINPTSLHACPHEDNIVAFGTKGGNVFIAEVDATGKNNAKILHKVRHEEEIVGTLWCPKVGWNPNRSDSKTKSDAILASSVQSLKAPTIRLWGKNAEDRGIYQVWEKERHGAKPFRNFSPLLWATDPNSGLPLLLTSAKQGQIMSYSSDSILPDIVHDVHQHSSIFGLVQCGDILWSTSYEPVIVGWNLRTMKVSCVIPTFKGVCAITPSPSVESLLAVGGNDACIRAVNFSTDYPRKNCLLSPSISSRMRSKIMALAWHPEKDNLIGFGTDDGVLGVFELCENRRHTMTFDRRVNGIVYAVDWGPSTRSKSFQMESSEENVESEKKSSLFLYACGGNCVNMINPSKPSNPLISVSKIIDATNPQSTRYSGADSTSITIASKASDIRWSPDFTVFAVGYNDGRVELYTPPFLQLKCWIKCHGRAIQFLSWRPFDFIQKKLTSDHKQVWFASTSNDATARLFNLEGPLAEAFMTDDTATPKLLISSAATLRSPNGERIISCAWSPHDPDLILTVSYDKSGIVWNITNGAPIARYFGHDSRLVAGIFHPTSKYSIVTASDELIDDSTIHVWDYRNYPFQENTPSAAKREKIKPLYVDSGLQVVVEKEPENPVVEVELKNASDHVRVPGGALKSTKRKKKHQTKTVTLLSSTAPMFTNSKVSLEAEIRYLVDGEIRESGSTASNTQNGLVPEKSTGAKCENSEAESSDNDDGKDAELGDSMIHLGLLGDFTQCVNMMKVECESHAKKGNWEKGCLLATWMGDSEFVEKCIREGEVTETVVLCAKTLGKQVFVAASEAYAEKLILQEDFSKAATYLFMAGQREKAIQVLADNKLYRDAVALIKVAMSKGHKIHIDTVKKWLTQLVQNGSLEVAAKVYCSVGLYGDALAVVEKRGTPAMWKTGMYLASKCGDIRKMQLFGLEYCVDSMMKGNHEEVKQVVNSYDELKWLLPFILTHEAVFHLSNKLRDAKNKGEEFFASDCKFKETVINQVDVEGLKKAGAANKIKETILVALAQNRNDAEVILTRTLVFMVLDDPDIKTCDKTEFSQLLQKWIAGDSFFQSAYEMAFNDVMSCNIVA
ncbi:Gem-associated protein 5 [Orchesella cincta]|uniref:Gem-associated protein 5 n=1 Tax=Orchesella cincta TaxID=48709 RepID=A0A1D2NFL8_ORCCI|nr:Gem-associated protein 5 [Orchesella cincta]